MHASRSPDLPALLELLRGSGLRFVVTGSVAARLHGADLETFGDLDIVPALDRENLAILGELIEGLEGKPAGFGHWETGPDGERRWIEESRDPDLIASWRPDPDDPSSFDHLLHTRLGNLDVVPELTGTFEELAPTTVSRNAWGFAVRVASLEHLLARLTVPRRDRDVRVVGALREIQRRRVAGGMPLLLEATGEGEGSPRRRMQFVGDHLVEQIVRGEKTASVVMLGEVDLEEDLYNSPLVVGELYDVYNSRLEVRVTVRIVGMELCRWDAIPERLWRGETNGSADEFRQDHLDYFRNPGPEFEFVAYYFERVDP